jgi:uncharacterized Zn finger protein
MTVSPGPGVHHRVLPRRLMIMCPVTGAPVDTGAELMAAQSMEPGGDILVDCIECGQDHPWKIEDAFLEGD